MHCTKATQDTKVMKIDKEKYIFLIKEIKDLILHLLVCLSRSNVALVLGGYPDTTTKTLNTEAQR